MTKYYDTFLSDNRGVCVEVQGDGTTLQDK